jgi:hypothetical protein
MTQVPRTPTSTLVKALELLARENGRGCATLLEAAQRLMEFDVALRDIVDVGCDLYDMDCGDTGSEVIQAAREVLGDDPS